MSKFINKFVTGISTLALAASMLIVPATTHAATAGEVYKTTDGTVWFITTSMQRRAFTSAGAFQSYGFLSFAQVKDADSAVLALPAGDMIAPQDGRIFCATETKGTDVKGECSLITAGKKAAFTSAAVFGAQGFSFANAYNGDSSFLSKTSNIDNGSAAHSAGVLVNNGGTIQLVVAGGLWGTPSMDVFNSWGWKTSDVVPANAADKALSQIGVIKARMAGELSPSATTDGGSGDGTLNGGAGDATITDTSVDVETTVNEGANNTYVQGFKVQADGSDIKVTSVKVTLIQNDNAAPTGSTRLERYAETVSVYMGSTKVGTADVSEFTKTGTTYTKSIALNNAIVREGSANKQTFHIAVSAVSNMDSADLGATKNNWKLDVDQIRFMDGTGITLTSSYSDTQNFSFDSLANSGDVKLTVSAGAANPSTGNVTVSDTSSTDNVLMLEFKLKGEGSDLTFDTLTADLTGVVNGVKNLQDMVSQLTLKQGSNVLATETTMPAADTGSVTFDLDNTYTLDKDTTDTFRIYAKIADVDNFTSGDSLAISVSAPSVVAAEDMNGDIVTESGTAAGQVQTFVIDVPTFALDSTPTLALFTHTDGTGAGLEDVYKAEFKISVTAPDSNDVYLPLDSFAYGTAGTQGVEYTATAGTKLSAGLAYTGTNSSVTSATNSYRISAGSTEKFTFTVYLSGTDAIGKVQIGSVWYEITDTAPDGTPEVTTGWTDFKTPAVFLAK